MYNKYIWFNRKKCVCALYNHKVNHFNGIFYMQQHMSDNRIKKERSIRRANNAPNESVSFAVTNPCISLIWKIFLKVAESSCVKEMKFSWKWIESTSSINGMHNTAYNIMCILFAQHSLAYRSIVIITCVC